MEGRNLIVYLVYLLLLEHLIQIHVLAMMDIEIKLIILNANLVTTLGLKSL